MALAKQTRTFSFSLTSLNRNLQIAMNFCLFFCFFLFCIDKISLGAIVQHFMVGFPILGLYCRGFGAEKAVVNLNNRTYRWDARGLERNSLCVGIL